MKNDIVQMIMYTLEIGQEPESKIYVVYIFIEIHFEGLELDTFECSDKRTGLLRSAFSFNRDLQYVRRGILEELLTIRTNSRIELDFSRRMISHNIILAIQIHKDIIECSFSDPEVNVEKLLRDET
ncbi:hypothetical protein PENTCL1PPCAC_24656 [Pristionchus entomophagus]|uniref:Uncharacterized protein n=1 Tax=Pristionchus entomophagus TaxID=358040 RepID=A0AAV5U7N2_9BILA|nr:hypothetical protein PENTCL1PPCAC_24656 [Pristionchus entomophagus]